MRSPDEKSNNGQDDRDEHGHDKDNLEFGGKELNFTHSVNDILPDGLIGKFVGDQDHDDDSREDQYKPDTGKEGQILPYIREIVNGNVWNGNRHVMVHVVNNVVDHELSHQDTTGKKYKVKSEKDPENPVCEDLF
jgi:hypothetical protein